MFRILSITGFAAVFLIVCLHHLTRPRPAVGGKGFRAGAANILRGLVFLLTLLLLPQRLRPLGVFRKLVFLLALVCFILLVISGFYPAIIRHKELSGYLLMLHVTAGGVFAGCVALLAILAAYQHTFNKNDWQQVLILTGYGGHSRDYCTCRDRSPGLGQKIAFWLILLLSLLVILSILLSMFRLFGTNMQRLLLQLHRYIALSLTVAGIVYLHLTTLAHKRIV
jgi:cytochrome b subunit of formate dehydrogenase